MDARGLIAVVSRRTFDWVWSRADALPPYHVVQGTLVRKQVDSDGSPIVHVAGTRIKVDRPTFDALTPGEYVRIRYTRGAHAINIDLYHGENSHG